MVSSPLWISWRAGRTSWRTSSLVRTPSCGDGNTTTSLDMALSVRTPGMNPFSPPRWPTVITDESLRHLQNLYLDTHPPLIQISLNHLSFGPILCRNTLPRPRAHSQRRPLEWETCHNMPTRDKGLKPHQIQYHYQPIQRQCLRSRYH